MIRLIVLAVALSGCAASNGNRSEACGFVRDAVACERAQANARSIANVKLGQSVSDVLSIMGGPDRRDAKADTESWVYRTHYRERVYSTIHFKGGVVSEIRSGR